LRKSQIHLTSFNTTRYVKLDTWSDGTNKPKQTQFKPNSKPILKMKKMNSSSFLTGNYEENWPGRLPKNKPNQTQYELEAGPAPTCLLGAQIPTGQLLRIFQTGDQFPTQALSHRRLRRTRMNTTTTATITITSTSPWPNNTLNIVLSSPDSVSRNRPLSVYPPNGFLSSRPLIFTTPSQSLKPGTISVQLLFWLDPVEVMSN